MRLYRDHNLKLLPRFEQPFHIEMEESTIRLHCADSDTINKYLHHNIISQLSS